MIVVGAAVIACGMPSRLAVPTSLPVDETETIGAPPVEALPVVAGVVTATPVIDVTDSIPGSVPVSTDVSAAIADATLSPVTTSAPGNDGAINATATTASPVPEAEDEPVSPLLDDRPVDHKRLQEELRKLIGTEGWASLGVPDDLAALAQAFVERDQPLDGSVSQWFQSLLDQRRMLEGLISKQVIAPPGIQPEIHVEDFKDEWGERIPVLYARAVGDRGARPQLFLIIRGEKGRAVGLALAPQLDKLEQRISPDGRFVLYFDERGRHLVSADALWVDKKDPDEKTLHEHLVDLYSKNNLYARASVFPRYTFPVEGIEAGFLGIELTLSYPQILLLNDAFSLYLRTELEPLKPAMFSSGISVIILDRLDVASGMNYSGTGLIILDRRDLFGNKYQLAQVLAHEATHVLQGDLTKGVDICKQLLRREVADQAVPVDMLKWNADQLLAAIDAGKVGAYHVSMWTLNRLNIRDLGWLQKIIQTGKYNGQSLLIGCDN